MRPRAWPSLLVISGAFGLLLLLASAASADMANPTTPFNPGEPKVHVASPAPAAEPESVLPSLAMSRAPATAAPAAAPAPEAAATEPVLSEEASEAAAAEAEPLMAPVATVMPEFERPAAAIRSRNTAERAGSVAAAAPTADDRNPFAAVMKTANKGVSSVGEFLAEVVSACKVGVTGATGGPVLAFAVLGMATAFASRRVLLGRWTTDEDPPEFLFAWDVIAPG